jgi:hypothetical protein
MNKRFGAYSNVYGYFESLDPSILSIGLGSLLPSDLPEMAGASLLIAAPIGLERRRRAA